MKELKELSVCVLILIFCVICTYFICEPYRGDKEISRYTQTDQYTVHTKDFGFIDIKYSFTYTFCETDIPSELSLSDEYINYDSTYTVEVTPLIIAMVSQEIADKYTINDAYNDSTQFEQELLSNIIKKVHEDSTLSKSINELIIDVDYQKYKEMKLRLGI